MSKREYLWVASCHGLESISEFNLHSIFAVKLYAMSNVQRYITFGTVSISPLIYRYIHKLIKDNSENCKAAWFLLLGKKEDKIPYVIQLLDSENYTEKKTGELISKGYEVTMYPTKVGIIPSEKVIGQYPKMFEDEFFQNL